MHPPTIPLLALGLDWLDGLLPLLFVLFWIVSQIVAVIRNVTGREGPVPRPPDRRPRRAAPGPGEPVPAGDARLDLERQIAEFLEQSRTGTPGKPRKSGPAERPPRPRPAAARRSGRPESASPTAPPPLLPAGRAAPAPAAMPAGSARAEFGTLGAAAPELSRHVADAFGRELAHLTPSLGETAGPEATGPTAAGSRLGTDLGALLADPRAIRRLILLREVLDRPVSRW